MYQHFWIHSNFPPLWMMQNILGQYCIDNNNILVVSTSFAHFFFIKTSVWFYRCLILEFQINLLFFAKSRELVGSGSGELVLTANTNFDTLKQALLLKYPS